ncbi:S8 family serine peptidase [Streptomyces sp. NBC_00654]|uniref:S8 family serine peptidase n=1 Tax=Streptomyces sp. NBC_00654 TaxID=2975799 RepID=UPI002257C0CE|nr:S8 family serine peptidase [Streptomyces sp. NBC_00654]MCX4966949.1 S8 family serine peptidase [Streptomyces sp. NBC_00654]
MPYDRCRRVMTLVAVAATAALLSAPPAVADGGEPVSLPPLRLRMSAEDSCATASAKTALMSPWTHRALQLSRSWQLSRGAGVTVAVVDTGVGARVPALAGRVTAVGGAGEDCVGHGSFAAGLIAAAPTGRSTVTGVAPGARILAVRGTDTWGVPDAGLIAHGIRTAVDKGAGVVYVGQVLDAGHRGLAAAVAHASEKDVLVVAPAVPDVAPEGADGRPDTRARPYWPARLPGVLSVVDHGPDGGRPKDAPAALSPDLSAPGGAVVGIGARGSGHFIGSGSSLAAAHVAGAAALLRAYHPELDAAATARRLTEAAYPDHTPRLDVYAGLTALLADQRAPAEKDAEPAVLPRSAAEGPRVRALLVGGGALALVLLVGAAMVVVPRGKARGWRPGT